MLDVPKARLQDSYVVLPKLTAQGAEVHLGGDSVETIPATSAAPARNVRSELFPNLRSETTNQKLAT